jgi:predicted membrane protein
MFDPCLVNAAMHAPGPEQPGKESGIKDMANRFVGTPLMTGGTLSVSGSLIFRIISLVLCAAVVAVLAVFWGSVMGDDPLLMQAILPVVLAGVAAGLAHGVGWTPRNVIVARLISPIVSWPLMVSALALLVLRTA